MKRQNRLEQRIEQLQKDIACLFEEGESLTSPQILLLSQRLDALIIQAQHLRANGEPAIFSPPAEKVVYSSRQRHP